MNVPLAAGAHQLTVAQYGRRVVRRDVRSNEGKTHTELVTLEPTTQRTLSELLFIGGGAALGASIVLSAFAVRSENRAEDFLQQQRSSGTSSSRQLVAYNASIVERNRYRTARRRRRRRRARHVHHRSVLARARSTAVARLRRRDEPRRSREAAPPPRFAFVSAAPATDVGASRAGEFLVGSTHALFPPPCLDHGGC